MLPLIRQWLADDAQQPRKQRRTAYQIWRQLCDDHGFSGAESTVRHVVRELKGEQRPVFVPLAFEPGEQAKVDWGTAQVILGGVVTTVPAPPPPARWQLRFAAVRRARRWPLRGGRMLRPGERSSGRTGLDSPEHRAVRRTRRRLPF